MVLNGLQRLSNLLQEVFAGIQTGLSQLYTIDMSGKAAGVYMVNITTSTEKITKQIILTK